MGGRALKIDLEGLRQMTAHLEHGIRDLPDVLRAAARGEGGRAIAASANAKIRHRTHHTRVTIEQLKAGPGGTVVIGVNEGNERMTAAGLAEVLESGAKPHRIELRKKLALHSADGPFSMHVDHPGAKGQKVMSKALRDTRWEFEAALVDELAHREWAAAGGGPT